MERSVTEYAKEKIQEVHALSQEYNGKDKPHTQVLLDLVKKHAIEIEELYENGDERFSVEVGDLLILCHELLLEHEKDPDEVMSLCYDRYKNKLAELIEKGQG
ncbi:MAG: hypothetical protein WBD00_01405 [Candidatus Omnitrophota bacterium]